MSGARKAAEKPQEPRDHTRFDVRRSLWPASGAIAVVLSDLLAREGHGGGGIVCH